MTSSDFSLDTSWARQFPSLSGPSLCMAICSVEVMPNFFTSSASGMSRGSARPAFPASMSASLRSLLYIALATRNCTSDTIAPM